MAESLYDILGVPRTASLAEIKRAYRRLARKYHPDVNPGDQQAAERFRNLSEAYAVLGDPKQRAEYDRFGRVAGAREGAGGPGVQFGGFDFSNLGGGSFADIFAQLFGGGGPAGPAAGPRRGEDLHATVHLGFEEAVRGTRKEVTIQRTDACPSCQGEGFVPTGAPCAPCKGTGKTDQVRSYLRFVSTCPGCGGSGRERAPCVACGGTGGIVRTETLKVGIPAGVDNGSTVRVNGKGQAGVLGAPPGDLYIQTVVAEHPNFERKGNNLYVRVPVPFDTAAKGGTLDVPTLDGITKIRIPPGTQNGQSFRIAGRGIVSQQTGRPGDLFAEARVEVPRVVDPQARQRLEEFRRAQEAAESREREAAPGA